MPVYSRLGRLAEKPKKESGGRPGWLSTLIGKSGFDPLGLGQLGSELGQVIPGLANLGTSLLPGGKPAGEMWSQAGKGIGSWALGMAGTPLAPLGQYNPAEMLGDKLFGENMTQDLFEAATNRGLAPALFDAAGAVALGGGAVASTLRRAGNASTKASVVARTADRAARAGIDPNRLAAVGKAGRQAGEQGRYMGPRSAVLGEEGIAGPLLKQHARAEARLARAGGDEAALAAGGTGRLYNAAQTAAHPYLEAGRRLVRPVTRAGHAGQLARTNPPTPELSVEQRALQAAEGLPGAEDAPDFYEAQRRATAQADAYEGVEAEGARVEAKAARDEAARADMAARLSGMGARPPESGPVRDRLLAAKNQPIPEWATRLVEGRPGAQDLLARAEGRIQSWESKQLRNETRRFAEADRRKLFTAIPGTKAAIQQLTEQFGVEPVKASRLVGDQLMAELDQRNILLAGRQLFPDNPVFEAKVQEAIGRKHLLPNDQLDAIRANLDAALDEWQALDAERTQNLLGSPERGLQGLEGSLDFDPQAFDLESALTPAQQKRFRQLIREYNDLVSSDTVEGRAHRARQRELVGQKSKLDRAVADLEHEQANLSDAQRAVIDQALPDTLQVSRRAATVARITEIMDGGTYDPWTDSIVTAADAEVSVGVVGTKIPMSEWQANPAAAFDDFVNRHATVLNDQDAKIGVWADGDSVYLDVAQTTIDGKRLSREQASVLGTARGEKAIWDFQAGAEGWLAQDTKSQSIAALHAAEVMKPGSQFNRFLARQTATRQAIEQLQTQGAIAGALAGAPFEVKLNPTHWDAKLQTRMAVAVTTTESGRFQSLDSAYGTFNMDARKTQTDVPGAMLQVYLNQSVEDAMVNLPADFQAALRQVGDGGRDSLNWYYDAHDFVATRHAEDAEMLLPRRLEDGTWDLRPVNTREVIWSILAVTSVNAGPLSNAYNTFQGITAFEDFMKGMPKEKLADLSNILDKYHQQAASIRSGDMSKAAAALADELFREVGQLVPHTGRVAADVLDILTERLVSEWDTGWLFERTERGRPMTREAAAGVLDNKFAERAAKIEEAKPGGKKRQGLEATQQASLEQIPANYEDLARRAAEGDIEAEAKITNVLGSRGYAKIRNFYANMSDPHANRGVTLDRVMAQSYGLLSEDWSGSIYDQVVQMVDGLANDLSAIYGQEILPHQIQALQWVATKQRMSAIEIGRRRAAMVDTLDLFDTTPADELQQIFGGPALDPVSRFYAEELALVDQGLQQRTADLVDEAGTRTNEEFLATVPKGKNAAGLKRRAGEWNERRGKIVEALERGDRAEAKRSLEAWLSDEASSFANVGEYYSTYADVGVGRPKVAGAGATLEQAADVAREHGYLGEQIFPASTPQTAAGLRALTPDELATLQERARARWDGMTHDGPAMLQTVGDDLAAGMTFMDRTGRITERFFRTADPTTLLHEEAHVLRLILKPDEIKQLLDAFPTRKITPPGQQSKRAAGLQKKFGPAGFEEWFAEAAVKHFATGEAPAGLEGVFGRIREALSQWWHASDELGDTPPVVAELLNRYLNPEDLAAPAAPTLGRTLDVPAKPGAVHKFAQAEKARPGETPQQTLKRGLKLGRQQERARNLAASVATKQARVARMEQAFADLPERLADLELPAEARKRRRMESISGQLETLRGKAEGRKLADVLPGHWMPLAGAIDNLRELAKQPGFESLAEVLAEIPDTLTGFMEYAQARGFNPTHVSSIPEAKVKRLVFGDMAPGREALEAGARKERKNPFPMDRSVEALMAAHLDVIREAQTGQFLQTVRDSFAVAIEAGSEVPPGWVEWDLVQRYMGVETDVDAGVKRAIGPGAPKYMVPKAVADGIKNSTRNMDMGVLRGLRAITSPWRTFVLTLSPRWYVNNMFGNLILASASGVNLTDWAKAWRAYRQGSNDGDFFDRHLGMGSDASAEVRQIVGRSDAVEDARMGTQALGDELTYKQGRAAGRSRYAAAKGQKERFLNKLSKANTVVDDFARTAVYFSGRRKGFTPQAAYQEAIRALVDYGDLGPVERSLVRSVIPFYAWQKGILKGVGKLAVDDPIRVAVMHQLGKLNDDLGSDLPEWYRQQLDIPGIGPTNIRPINPFADVTALLTPEGIANSMNPHVESMLRSSLDAPAEGYTDQYRVDQFGRAMPDVNPIAGATDLLTSLPQVRAAGVGDQGAMQGLRGYLGVPAVRSEGQLQGARDRMAKSEARVRGLTPIQAGLTQPKARESTAVPPQVRAMKRRLLPELPEIPRPRLPDLG